MANTFGPNDYILYVSQEANFQSRSMLIPAQTFVTTAEYALLKEHAKPCTLRTNGQKYVVDHLLLNNYVWEGWCGTCEKTSYTDVCHMLTGYADGMYDDPFDDGIVVEPWYPKAITNVCNGFNHLKNYTTWRYKKTYKGRDINVVDGFFGVGYE